MSDYLGYERAFKAFGIPYTIQDGAYDRGHGDLKEVRFIVIHHTAGGNDAGDINIVTNGRSDLPGPLSQIVLKRNGNPHIIAVGVSWQAPGSITYRGVAPGNGNWYSIGIEGVSNGYNDWTNEQRAMYPKVVAALLKDMNLPSDAFIFHRDYQPGEKIDPGGFTREWFQAEVNKHYNSGGLPVAPTKSAIQIKRDQEPWLGDKTSEGDELVLPDKLGRATFYGGGAIYFTPVTGAQSINAEILAKYANQAYETGLLKYPINSTYDLAPDGKRRAQAFQGGSIYWSETNGAHFVGGSIGSKWAELGWEKGILGMPVTDEITLPDKVGKLQVFEHGHIYHHPDTGSYPILGVIWDRFAKENYESYIGYPKTTAINLPNTPGQFQIFTNAQIYVILDKAYVVYSDFMYYYERLGYEAGQLGVVISNKEKVADTNNTWIQHFAGGSIQIDRNTKEAVLLINGQNVTL